MQGGDADIAARFHRQAVEPLIAAEAADQPAAMGRQAGMPPREMPAAPVFIEGKKVATLRGADVADQFKLMVSEYIEQRFGQGAKTAAE